jgi:hypothetical protein
MRHTVFYGFHHAHVSEERFLRALASVTRDFDESPRSMLCLLAEPVGDVTWFTFVCSVFKRDAAMAAGFFRDMFCQDLPDFAVHERDDILTSDYVFRHYKEGRIDLEVRSDGREVAITKGTIDPAIPREGDAVHLGLRALGWPTERVWQDMEAKRAVVLREEAARKAPLVIEPRAKKGAPRLPPVKVIRGYGEIGFSYWRDHAAERFPLRAVKEEAGAQKASKTRRR